MTIFYSASVGGFLDDAIHSVIPDDAKAISKQTHAGLLAGQSIGKRIVPGADGFPVLEDPPPPSASQVQGRLAAAVQTHLDNFARQRGYDSILSACTYATSTVPSFQREGQRCVTLRDATWAACYAILASVQAGQSQVPSAEALLASLPPLTWEN